jgi:F-type H+-transporting ATPase subunit gamma
MTQLVQMQQRIKAIETIKKITHAMRLISMSTHSRLRHKKTFLENYRNAFEDLWIRINRATRHTITIPEKQAGQKAENHLIILVGSQKGLCGTFNISLFKFFEQDLPTIDHTYYFITVGKYATDYLERDGRTLLATYNNLSSLTFVSIARAITGIILSNPRSYSTVTLYSNWPKTFFVQKPQKSIIIPFKDIADTTGDAAGTEYLFEQTPEELTSTIRHLMLVVTLQDLLFESLLSEQAARFLSMDTSTRNADSLLNQMKLAYNKTRQAAITRELTELAGSLL